MKHFNATHGQSRTRLYQIWNGVIYRCENIRSRAFKYYGGRGIKVCAKWHTFEGFFEDMAEGYANHLTIERKNVDGDYCKENCRWATRAEQMNNKRTNRIIEHDGKSMTMAEWAVNLGIKYSTLAMRFQYGWSIEKALTTPLISGRPR